MRRTLLLGTVAAASLALLAACNKTDNQAPAPAPASPMAENTQTGNTAPAPGSNNETVSAVQDAVSGAVGSVAAATTTSAQGFVDAVANSDMYEIQAAKIALQRSQRADVKSFAQQMMDDHTATSDTLHSLLTSAHISANPPTILDGRHKSMIDNLTGAADADFDNRYIDQQEMAHNQAVTLFKTYADNGDNADLKQFASATLPKLNEHLTMARSLANGNPRTNAPTQ